MKTSRPALWIAALMGTLILAQGDEPDIDSLTGEEWVKAHAKAAEHSFEELKSAEGNAREQILDEFFRHVMRGSRSDLALRQMTGDRLKETEIFCDLPPTQKSVAIHDLGPALLEGTGDYQWRKFTPVWRRITKDRFEIWTPNQGKLFDAKGRRVASATVRRGDGCGREWYGAFLPDGRWVTADLNERDDTLFLFSAKGKRVVAIKGDTLIPTVPEGPESSMCPLIAWARSNKDGKAWIVSVGSEWGRGWVKVTPEGKWSHVENPWKECFPQQLGPRGMYTGKSTWSDDGTLQVTRHEPGHGVGVGWPCYNFHGCDGAAVMLPDGEQFGILPDGWAVFVQSGWSELLPQEGGDRSKMQLWLFDQKGHYRHWIEGQYVGVDLVSKGMWVRLPDGSSAKVGKNFMVESHIKFETQEGNELRAVELHEDIGLGLFLMGNQLALGTWDTGKGKGP